MNGKIEIGPRVFEAWKKAAQKAIEAAEIYHNADVGSDGFKEKKEAARLAAFGLVGASMAFLDSVSDKKEG